MRKKQGRKIMGHEKGVEKARFNERREGKVGRNEGWKTRRRNINEWR